MSGLRQIFRWTDQKWEFRNRFTYMNNRLKKKKKMATQVERIVCTANDAGGKKDIHKQ